MNNRQRSKVLFALFFSVNITYMIASSRISSKAIFLPRMFSIGDKKELKKDRSENEDTSEFSDFFLFSCREFILL